MRKTFAIALALIVGAGPLFAAEGALNGKFSVNAKGQTVQFAKGNLQYQASTKTWRLAANQWTVIGDDNAKVAPDFAGWIDLFGWGTGNNPTLATKNDSDYVGSKATFKDWSKNAISNGGNKANLWRTLTKDEWVYILFTRPNADKLFGLGSVNGINGTILLPDNWALPAGAKFVPNTTKGLANKGDFYKMETQESIYAPNTYTVEQWKVLEAAGAVFLPAGGSRYGDKVKDVNVKGEYWTSTLHDEYTDGGFYLVFTTKSIGPKNYCTCVQGNTIRPVISEAANAPAARPAPTKQTPPAGKQTPPSKNAKR